VGTIRRVNLSPHPFCGHENPKIELEEHCANIVCPECDQVNISINLCAHGFRNPNLVAIDAWEDRPIEFAMGVRIMELEQQVAQLKGKPMDCIQAALAHERYPWGDKWSYKDYKEMLADLGEEEGE